jgi:hypothetical protein
MRWALLWGLLIGLVLLPFFLFEAQFNALSEQITRSGMSRSVAAAGIFALLALDVFLPVPSSIVATGAGVILGLAEGTAVVWGGMMAGCLIGYGTGVRAAATARWIVGPDSLARVVPSGAGAGRGQRRVRRYRARAVRALCHLDGDLKSGHRPRLCRVRGVLDAVGFVSGGVPGGACPAGYCSRHLALDIREDETWMSRTT